MGIEFVYKPETDDEFVKDGDGYWICVGALNCFNKVNDFYVYDERIKELFLSKKSRFGTLMLEGLLGGEAEHPKLPKGLSAYEANHRLLTIEPSRRSHNITGIKFKETDQYSVTTEGKSATSKLVKIYCRIVPVDNELGRTLKSLIDGGGNVAFSLRTFSDDVLNQETGYIESFLTNPITFDWVTRGGIGVATKNKTDAYIKNEDDLSGMYSVAELANCVIPDDNDIEHKCENHDAVKEAIEQAKEYMREKRKVGRGSSFLDRF